MITYIHTHKECSRYGLAWRAQDNRERRMCVRVTLTAAGILIRINKLIKLHMLMRPFFFAYVFVCVVVYHRNKHTLLLMLLGHVLRQRNVYFLKCACSTKALTFEHHLLRLRALHQICLSSYRGPIVPNSSASSRWRRN